MTTTHGNKFMEAKEELRKLLPEECRKDVLKVVDRLYFDLKTALDSGRTLERLLTENGVDIHTKDFFYRYMEVMGEESQKFNDYDFEEVEDEWEEEAL